MKIKYTEMIIGLNWSLDIHKNMIWKEDFVGLDLESATVKSQNKKRTKCELFINVT